MALTFNLFFFVTTVIRIFEVIMRLILSLKLSHTLILAFVRY